MIVLHIFNKIISTGSFPSSWNNFLILFIPKSKPNSYRPISLASCLFKLLEKLIHARLVWFVEHNSLLSSSQFGFRKGKSCADNLAILASEVWTGFVNREVTAAAFLDIKGAFPSVSPQLLTEDLRSLGIPWTIAKFIYNSTACKKLFFNIDSEIIGPRISTVGLPQGSILSPVLYSIYTRDLQSLLPPNCILIEFADDLCVICRGSDPVICIESLQDCLNIISDYLNNKNLDLCPQKTQLLLFTKRNLDLENRQFSLTLNDIVIHPSLSAVFLGITFDDKFTFDEHFIFLAKRAREILSILGVLTTTWWGADPSILLKDYDSMIRSPFDYGSHIYTFKRLKFFDKLEKIRNEALRICVGYRKSTPINVMLAETCEPPLRKRFCFLAKKYIIKTFSNINHPLINTLNNLENIIQGKNPYFIRDTFILIIAFEKVKNFKLQIRSSSRQPFYEFPYEDHMFIPEVDIQTGKIIQNSQNPNMEFLDLTTEKYFDYSRFYTDGSKDESNGTAGCSSVNTQSELEIKSWKLSQHASIFSIEAIAILRTLDNIIQKNIRKSVIFSDSLSVISNIASKNPNSIKSYLIFLIRNRLYTIFKQNHIISLVWIPGHKGIVGNELADEAAKEAAIDGVLSRFPLPCSDFFSIPRFELNVNCQEYFKDIGQIKGKYYTDVFYKKQTKPWFRSFTARRHWIVSICRMRSNHYSSNWSLARKNIIASSSCTCDPNVDQDLDHHQDLDHILWACPCYNIYRKQLLTSLSRALKCRPPFSSVQFPTNPSTKICSHIFRFLKKCNLKI